MVGHGRRVRGNRRGGITLQEDTMDATALRNYFERRRLRVLRDEVNNEEYYLIGNREVYPEDIIPEEERKEE
jgi:hypothetical protein